MRSSLAAAVDEYPVHPLTGAVLFPSMVMPLVLPWSYHRRMAAQARSARGMWLVSMIRGEVDADNRAAVHPVGCLARAVRAEPLADGRVEVWLEGVGRAKLTSDGSLATGVRLARAEPVVEVPAAAGAALSRLWPQLRRQLHGTVRQLRRVDRQLAVLLAEPRAPMQLLDVVATLLVPSPLTQQALLAQLDPEARTRQVIDCLVAAQVRLAAVGGPSPGPL